MGALIELNLCTLPRKGKLPLDCRQIAADCHRVTAKCDHVTGILLRCPGTSTGGRSCLIGRILRCQALSHDVICKPSAIPPFFSSSLYLKCPFYMYIVTTASPELRLYKRGGSVTEPHRRGLHRRAPCSRVHLAYSLRQLRVGISPPYALDPYDRSRNVL